MSESSPEEAKSPSGLTSIFSSVVAFVLLLVAVSGIVGPFPYVVRLPFALVGGVGGAFLCIAWRACRGLPSSTAVLLVTAVYALILYGSCAKILDEGVHRWNEGLTAEHFRVR